MILKRTVQFRVRIILVRIPAPIVIVVGSTRIEPVNHGIIKVSVDINNGVKSPVKAPIKIVMVPNSQKGRMAQNKSVVAIDVTVENHILPYISGTIKIHKSRAANTDDVCNSYIVSHELFRTVVGKIHPIQVIFGDMVPKGVRVSLHVVKTWLSTSAMNLATTGIFRKRRSGAPWFDVFTTHISATPTTEPGSKSWNR